MLDSRANRCFVCGPGNDRGLGVQFRLEGDVCRAEFVPTEIYAGYDGVIHGGILFCLLDDVMANLLYLQGERCFTARAEVRYRQPLPVGTPVRMEGHLLRRKGRLAVIEGRVFRQDDGSVVVESTGSFMLEGTLERR